MIPTFLSIALLCIPVSIAPSAQADDLAPCRIKASDQQWESLGFPVPDERLAKVTLPKILVVPFQLKDNPNFKFTTAMKNEYLRAEKNISMLSGNISTVEFVFADTIKTSFTNQTMDKLKANQLKGMQKEDESNSTWGFVRKVVTNYDPQLDFTGISGVILHGSSTSPKSSIGEAMTYRKDFGDPFFRPLVTNEGPIMNAVLLDTAKNATVITHEVLHLYGLPDLYGNKSAPEKLSLMAGNLLRLLNYEKWILGWLSDSAVQCQAVLSDSKIQRFTFDLKKKRQLLIAQTVNGTILIVESSTFQKRLSLAFYTLDNEKNPPIALFTSRLTGAGREGIPLDSVNAIGVELEGPEISLLVSNMKNSRLTFGLIPTSMKGSPEYIKLKKSKSA
jgi:hypothetical protein